MCGLLLLFLSKALNIMCYLSTIFLAILGFFLCNLNMKFFDIFVKFKLHVENLFSSKIKSFQSNGGSEYTKRAFQNLLANNGISFHSSCPGHPEQNGLAERKHRHIVETGLTILAHAHMLSTY
jgi:transposase InsO family protein